MKIAMIGQKGMPANYGGVERHVHDLSLRLVEFGFDVTVYSRKWYTKSEDTEIAGVKIKHLPTIHSKHFDTIVHTFLATIHAIFSDYNIIHYHGVGPSLVSWLPRIFSPKKQVITTFHSIDRYHQKWDFIAKLVLRLGEWTACKFAHQTITVSQSLKHYCINEFNRETNYIPNGVITNQTKTNASLIEQFGLAKDNYLVMVSRLVPHKGAHLLVEAFTNLKRKYKDDPQISNLKLAIVGGSVYTDDYVRALHQQASTCNDVVFTDFQSGEALEQLYANSMALVHPSLNEGLPITVLEAMNLTKPVLVSNIPEHLELIHDIRAVFSENNTKALENKIYKFIKLSAEEKAKMGAENKKIIESFYSWDVIVPQIVELYESSQKKKTKLAQATI